MKRYIDANVAIYKIVTNKNFIDSDKYPHDCCCDIIEAIPIVDAVEVVRCKDCEWYEDPRRKIFENCVRGGRTIPMQPTDFCSYGKPKDGDT